MGEHIGLFLLSVYALDMAFYLQYGSAKFTPKNAIDNPALTAAIPSIGVPCLNTGESIPETSLALGGAEAA